MVLKKPAAVEWPYKLHVEFVILMLVIVDIDLFDGFAVESEIDMAKVNTPFDFPHGLYKLAGNTWSELLPEKS